MWAIFIGFALGVFQVMLLRKTVIMMTASKTNISLGVMISVGKLALILVTLWLLGKYVSLNSVLWCAGGLAIAMIGMPIVNNIRENKKTTAEQQGKGGAGHE